MEDGNRMVVMRRATFWLGLFAPVCAAGANAESGAVMGVDVRVVSSEPGDIAFGTSGLRRGRSVAIVPGGDEARLAIGPHADAFDRAAIRETADGRAEVIVDRAPIRSERPGARMPVPPRPALPRGAVVVLPDRPPVALAQGQLAPGWRAIRPPDEVRFVRAEGVRRDSVPLRSPPAERRANLGLLAATDAPTDVVAATAPAPAPGVDPIDASRRFDAAVARSRRRDHEVDQVRAGLEKARTTIDRGYDAKGFLQASSRKVDGQKVHALIGPEGTPVAYLDIPPGIATAPLLSRKIGVRGSTRFVESLGTRLISVRDLDPLDDSR